MPRDGSGIYSRPPGTNGVPDTTIESTKYNGFVGDVETDLNAPRPIIAGGTGASSASAARANISAEVRGVRVLNYDTHVFEAGSFYSLPGATAAPNATYHFVGICYLLDAANITLEARQIVGTTPSTLFIRQSSGGAWGAWVAQAADLDAQYVNVTGDTMTGILSANAGVSYGANPDFKTHATGTPAQYYRTWIDSYYQQWDSGTGRFRIVQNNTECFSMTWDGNAAFIGTVNAVNFTASSRLTGDNFVVSSYGIIGTGTTGGVLYFKLDTSAAITYDTAGQFNFTHKISTPSLTSAGGVTSIDPYVCHAPVGGQARYQCYAGGTFRGQFYYEPADDSMVVYHSSANSIRLTTGGTVNVGTGICSRQGTTGGYGAYTYNFYWTTTALECWIGAVMAGNVNGPSDYRIKKDVVGLDSQWDAVKALRPIRYTQADFTPPAEKAARAKEALEEKLRADERHKAGEPPIEAKPAPGAMFTADNIERWGFVAHELQETLVESASTGVKDSPDVVQTPNPWTVIAALTKALQEAMARIEALEATVG